MARPSLHPVEEYKEMVDLTLGDLLCSVMNKTLVENKLLKRRNASGANGGVRGVGANAFSEIPASFALLVLRHLTCYVKTNIQI